jgi:hypothetical protein
MWRGALLSDALFLHIEPDSTVACSPCFTDVMGNAEFGRKTWQRVLRLKNTMSRYRRVVQGSNPGRDKTFSPKRPDRLWGPSSLKWV